jgi:hypothetical protein
MICKPGEIYERSFCTRPSAALQADINFERCFRARRLADPNWCQWAYRRQTFRSPISPYRRSTYRFGHRKKW